MKKARKAFTIFELVIVIAVIAIMASVIIPQFADVVAYANDTAALKEVRSSLPDYIASYNNTVQFACMYNINNDNGYYVFLYDGGALKYAGDISKPAVSQLNPTYVGSGSVWYAFTPKQGYENLELNYTEGTPACGQSNYSGFYINIGSGEESGGAGASDGNNAYGGQCSFGPYESGAVIHLNSDVTVSKYISHAGESILLNEDTSPPYNEAPGEIVIPGDEDDAPEEIKTIKNIIYLIPDGSGWDMYDLANKVKADITEKGLNGISGAATPATVNAISGMTVTQLYLDSFMVGTAKATLAVADNGSWYPDSAAAGTATASGKKTKKDRVSSDIEMKPISNILEICDLAGKATGLVTTNSWIDATPSGFMSHSDKNASRTKFYQREISYQMLNSGIDILLASGTDNGTYTKNNGFLHSLHASDLGYLIVNNLSELENAVQNGEKMIWSNFLEGNNGDNNGYDYTDNHIKFDIYAAEGDLTLLKMTKAALSVLSENIDNENGFFLTIEGGAIEFDNENTLAAEAVGEYLSFDETFAYCVNWAKGRDDTIVVVYPNHDSGGYIIGENIPVTAETALFDTDNDSLLSREECLNYVSDCIIRGNPIGSGDDTDLYLALGNTEECVTEIPLWLYAPDWCRDGLLEAIGLPSGNAAGTASVVRTGSFNNGTVINPAYSVENSDITAGVLEICGLMTMEYADSILFSDATPYISSINWNKCTVSLKNGEIIPLNSRFWFMSMSDYNNNLNRYDFPEGRCVYMFDCQDDPYAYEINYRDGTVYLPKSFLISRGYING
ncbi:MAG: alkaline phosphatase [Eubacteriales bacterium]|nr:alkaline phosphatase [Eubacteriales bacterium]